MSKAGHTRIVFMGTPDFAVASAEALHTSGFQIVAAVTVPDKPAGRGQRLQESAVKQWASAQWLPVLQPQDLREPHFLQQLREFGADLYVIVAFRILPREVFSIPPLGTINLHASLLPKYRGAAPINWALIEGEHETGVTTFVIDDKVDTGGILLQRRTAIGAGETFGELYDRLKNLGAEVLVETIKRYAGGEIEPQRQEGEPTRAPKLTPALRIINWTKSAERIYNLVRGLSPVPCAYTTINGKTLKIYSSRIRYGVAAAKPGRIVTADKKTGVLEVQTGENFLRLLDVQLEGKKRMAASDFLRGFPIQVGDALG